MEEEVCAYIHTCVFVSMSNLQIETKLQGTTVKTSNYSTVLGEHPSWTEGEDEHKLLRIKNKQTILHAVETKK